MSINLLAEETVPCYVGGKAFTGSGTYNVNDPHNGELLYKVSSVTEKDVDGIITTAIEAGKTWKKTSVLERRRIFLKAVSILRERAQEYAGIEFKETTSSAMWSGFEQNLAAESLEETAAAATVALRGEICTTDQGQRAYIERTSYGVVFGMAPWNAPLVLGQRACMQPIMAGNAAILKTSELSPKTHLIIAQIFHEAGLPEGVLNIIHVAPQDAPKVVEKIIAADGVGKVNFTGSTRVGAIVAQTCGKHIKPVVLELGGKAPMIIREDADLKLAASAALFGSFFHSGQICMATNTVLVHESISTEFLSLVKSRVSNLSASSTPTSGAALRGLFTDAHAKRADEIIGDAVDKGAEIVAGKRGLEKNVVQPVVLKGVDPSMRMYKDEMFSPVLSLMTYKDISEAIKIANDHEYGLAASIYSKDIDAAHTIAREIDSGMVHINGSSVHDSAQVPHGGWKKSGFGRFNGIEGIREFAQIKVITVNQPHPYPI